MPKPVAALTIPKAYEVDMGPCSQGEVVQTPVTPVTVEALTSLQNLIKQDTHTLDESSKQCLQRHLQKLSNAAQISFAERALQQDQMRFLSKVNNEAKVRRSTKSVVLGKAKVMSYEDLVGARAKRAAKDAVKEKGKGKRGRKRKSPVPEADLPEPKAKGKRGRKRKNPAPEADALQADAPEPKAKVARMREAPEPASAPVARMY